LLKLMGAQSQSYVGIAFEMTIIKSSGRQTAKSTVTP
jgi:hypothetical protein